MGDFKFFLLHLLTAPWARTFASPQSWRPNPHRWEVGCCWPECRTRKNQLHRCSRLNKERRTLSDQSIEHIMGPIMTCQLDAPQS